MKGKKLHTIHSNHQHMSWCNSRTPAQVVAPGDEVQFEVIDAVCGQLSPESTVEDVENLDFDLVNPISGPIYVDGAEPGDSLKVTILGFEPSGWGWTAIIPGFGLLADDFANPSLNIWKYELGFETPCVFNSHARVPLKPFCGTIGVAHAEAGEFSTIPPYATGGNMDIRDINIGTDLYIPVEVPGALFSIGDPHCAQGDGEVCGTAIESPMGVTVRLDLVKGENLRFPRYVTPGPVSRHHDELGYEVTTGIGPDLMEASQNAVRGMIDRLMKLHKLDAAQAYMLCSVTGDLRISEIVDRPNWVVSFYMPNKIFQ